MRFYQLGYNRIYHYQQNNRYCYVLPHSPCPNACIRRSNSISKFGVKIPLPNLDFISLSFQNRPSSISTGSIFISSWQPVTIIYVFTSSFSTRLLKTYLYNNFASVISNPNSSRASRSLQGILHSFAIIHMPAYRCIPFAGLYILIR